MTSWAPLLLALSIAARLAWAYLLPTGTSFVDLHVYVGGAATIGTPLRLYDYTYVEYPWSFPLPFTYPPFAALVFYPLTLLPFGLVALAWQLGIFAALYAAVRVSQRLLTPDGTPGRRETAMLWTAVGIWTEPVRATLDFGQVNVILMLAVLYAVYSNRWWLSGLLVGLAAGIKLTPAVSGLYFVGVRRWSAAVFSVVVFVATVALSLLVLGGQARLYFTDLLGDAHRVGPIGTGTNQSWRGGISRILGHDAGFGPLVMIATALTAVFAVLAWRALAADDRLGRIVIVMLFGLVFSPISWSHHWVWVVPTMIWLIHGAVHTRPGARLLGYGWLALTLIGPPWLLNVVQESSWIISRPWWQAWGGLAYIVAALGTMAWVAASGRLPALRATGKISLWRGGLTRSRGTTFTATDARSRRSREPSPDPSG